MCTRVCKKGLRTSKRPRVEMGATKKFFELLRIQNIRRERLGIESSRLNFGDRTVKVDENERHKGGARGTDLLKRGSAGKKR